MKRFDLMHCVRQNVPLIECQRGTLPPRIRERAKEDRGLVTKVNGDGSVEVLWRIGYICEMGQDLLLPATLA